jgi:glutaredoxin 3
MPRVEIYSTLFCGYCARAKSLLQAKGIDYIEIDVMADTEKQAEMIHRTGGRRTVPQIFVDSRHVGGWEELYALERQGKLDGLLEGVAR